MPSSVPNHHYLINHGHNACLTVLFWPYIKFAVLFWSLLKSSLNYRSNTMTCIFGLNTWQYKKTQTHLLYGSGHGGHGSSLSARAAHTCQVLGHWNRHLGASLLQNISKEEHKHKWLTAGLRGTQRSLDASRLLEATSTWWTSTWWTCLIRLRQVQIKVLDWRFPTQHSRSGNNLPWRIDAPRCPVSPVWDEIWPHWQNSAGTRLHPLPPGSHSHDTGPRPPGVHTFKGQMRQVSSWFFSENPFKGASFKGLKWWSPAHLHPVASIFVVHDDHVDLYNTTEELLKVGPWWGRGGGGSADVCGLIFGLTVSFS